MFVKKLIDTTCSPSAVSVFFRRYLQTVGIVEPKSRTAVGSAGVVEGLQLSELPPLAISRQDQEVTILPKEIKIAKILEEVRAVDGLPSNPSHIEHLVGRATKGRIYQKQGLFPKELSSATRVGDDPLRLSTDFIKTDEKYEAGGIDIAEKTQLILQSPHPVRYVIEKEIYNSQKGLRLRLPSFHTWIMLFGRSLVNRQQYMGDTPYNVLLNNVANASDSGMFSADIHNTMMDITEDHSSFKNCSTQYHMGNKYAVLVGDYFAIRCIYYAERTKTNSVMVAITEGVEEFTTCTFGTNLFDEKVNYPIMLSPSASILDWILYNQKAFGYFKGGLYAALSLQYKSNLDNPSNFDKNMEKFVGNLTAFIKASVELDALERNDFLIPSPFLLTSLPAILYQMENPKAFDNLRKSGYELNADYLSEIHDTIRKSSLSAKRTRNLLIGFATETKQAFHKIAKDDYYKQVFDTLIDVAAAEG